MGARRNAKQKIGHGWIVVLIGMALLALAGCGGAPQPPADPNIDFADPDVGGGVGQSSGPETPIPTPTITREPSPRLDSTAAAGTIAAGGVLPTATALPPTPAILPTAAPASTPLPEVTEPPPLPTDASAEPPPTEAPAATPTAEGERIHVVQAGETLYRIGLQYGVSWPAIAEYNGITNPDAIYAGQELRIPPAPTPPPPAEESSAVVATVVAGDTLYAIAQQYGVDWVQLAEANGLETPNQLYPGRQLKIPPDVTGPAPAFNHRVHRGETLVRIAAQYGLPAADLAEANDLTAPFVIYAGQELVIPGDE